MLYWTAYSNSDIIDSFIDEMKRYLDERNLRKCMDAVRSYYSADMSVTEAAAALGIHKNTLQSRVKRVIEAAGIEDYPPAGRAYVMRLISIRLTVIKKTSSSLNKLG